MTKPFIFIFPGQGSQKVGMGQELYKNHRVAKDVFDEIDETLGMNLSKICFEGPDSELTLTSNTQPALMAVSIAIVRIIEHELQKKISALANIVLGHSLGEYSALCSIGSISLSSTAKLLRERGLAMQNAISDLETSMRAVIGMDLGVIEDTIEQTKLNNDEICEVANDNSPGQTIISGTKIGVEIISSELKKKGARSLIDLNVSAPFHCSLMKPASQEFKKHIIQTEFSELQSMIISNVNANLENNLKKIKGLLVEQIYSRVRWRESIIKAENSNPKSIIEIGCGKVLTGINKRIGINCDNINISNISDFKTFTEHYAGIL